MSFGITSSLYEFHNYYISFVIERNLLLECEISDHNYMLHDSIIIDCLVSNVVIVMKLRVLL